MTNEPEDAAEEVEEEDLSQIPGFWLLGLLADITSASCLLPEPPMLESGQLCEKRTKEEGPEDVP